MENFSDIIKSDSLTLVDFFATWCGPCKMMHPVLEQLKKDLGDGIRIIKLDVDENEDFSMQYNIQSVPTLMLFKKGEVVWRQSGAQTLNELKSIIAQHSKNRFWHPHLDFRQTELGQIGNKLLRLHISRRSRLEKAQ